MHIHTGITEFLFIGVSVVIWRNVMPMLLAWLKQYGLPTDTLGKLVTA